PFADGQATVARNMFAQETEDGNAFLTGDIYALKIGANYASFALQCGHLYGDAGLRAQAKHYTDGFRKFGNGVAQVNVTEFLILSSDNNNAAKNRYDGFPTVAETAYPFGTVTVRNRFDRRPAIAYMKIGERSMANHDHADHGTFQLYYKGLLTGDGGLYSGYGSDQHYFFHRATVAHNGLLIYNPALAEIEPVYNEWKQIVNREGLFYSGGERYVPESTFLGPWMSEQYDFAKVIGKGAGYYADGGAEFAYLAGDITNAYPAGTADLVKRQMLTVFTKDDGVPMLFLTCDKVVAKDKDFKKTYLLQAPFEPKIVGNTVKIDNGNANLTLHILSDDCEVSAIGGKGRTFYLPECGRTLLPPNGAEPREWGRVLVQPKTASAENDFLMAYVVADNGAQEVPVPERLIGEHCTGVRIGKYLAVFADGDDVSFEISHGAADGYLAGLASGRYEVRRDGGLVGTYALTGERGVLKFRTTDGKITVRKLD
ncbi:MAG: heparinase II/III-family protein, partial [Clostridia bacterium]|nr:heparinase II/III-family protein [Clostridia bacterium]